MAHSVNTSKKWHQLARKLYVGVKATDVIPTLNTEDVSASSNSAKATLFNNYFTSKGLKSIPHALYPSLPLNTSKVLSNVHFDQNDICKALAMLDPSKSTGPDGITNLVLRNSSSTSVYFIQKILGDWRYPPKLGKQRM